MKKKINLTFCIISIAAVFITVFISMVVSYSIFKKHILNDLEAYAEKIEQQDVINNLEALKQEFIFAGIRVTLIDDSGMVLYDSKAQAQTMENHSTRPEFKEALEKGEGESLRNSETVGATTYYYARELESGNVLRVSREAETMVPLFTGALILLVLTTAVLIIICLITSGILTRRIVKPIELIAGNIENIENINLYDELIPLVRKIKEQHIDIENNMEELNRENHKIQMITKNMSEGIIFLDKHKKILSLNDSAVSLLSLREKEYTQQNILNAVRNNDIINSIDMAYTGESNFIEISLEDRQLQIFSNPILDSEEAAGVMCFILDITQRYNQDKIRREFTANVSHELKTPLTSISGYSELIKLNIAKSGDVTDFATKIYNESMRLLALINDIIKLSELDEGVSGRELVTIDLIELAKECIRSLESSALKKDITIRVTGDKGMILGTRSMIYELIFNLVDNAIRYNRQDGFVDILVIEERNAVSLTVKDTGIGIPGQYQDRVFERFFRVDKSRSKATGGTGLGLSIVKHIANAHNAVIECKSEEGEGTSIKVTFKKI